RSPSPSPAEAEHDRGLRVTGPALLRAAGTELRELGGEGDPGRARRAVVDVGELVRVATDVVELAVAVEVLDVGVRVRAEPVVLGDVLDVLDPEVAPTARPSTAFVIAA